MSKSTYVCQRCGCAIYTWREAGKWKHATGGRGPRSCGKPPIVVERAAYEKWMSDMAKAAVAAVRRHLDR